MKEEMQYWFHGLGYKEGFDADKVPSAEVKKRQINTHVILNAVSQMKRRNIFGYNGVFMHFF